MLAFTSGPEWQDTPIAGLDFTVLIVQGSLVGGDSESVRILQADRYMKTCSAQLMSLVLAVKWVGADCEENQVLHDNRALRLGSNLVFSKHFHIHYLILSSERCCECVITTLFCSEEKIWA